jgi:hypothetical protein
MIAACGGSAPNESTATSSSAGGGAPIDGMQACIEAFTLNGELCPPADPDPVATCKDIFQNAGPDCADETALEYDCYRNFAKAQDPNNHDCPLPWPKECLGLSQASSSCAHKFGCVDILDSCNWGPRPDGGVECSCIRECMLKFYKARCWASGTTSTCDCLVDDVSVGTCDGGAMPVCDKYLLESCCNQYFMLLF